MGRNGGGSGGSGAPKPPAPCAACRLLRRKCVADCPFAPYFHASDPHRFSAVHKIFGASNVSKMLLEVPEGQRSDVANSLVYEAKARMQDPVLGCLGIIAALQQEAQALQSELHAARTQIMRLRFQESAMAAAASATSAAGNSSNHRSSTTTITATTITTASTSEESFKNHPFQFRIPNFATSAGVIATNSGTNFATCSGVNQFPAVDSTHSELMTAHPIHGQQLLQFSKQLQFIDPSSNADISTTLLPAPSPNSSQTTANSSVVPAHHHHQVTSDDTIASSSEHPPPNNRLHYWSPLAHQRC